MSVRVVFLHGWGFDASFWDATRALLPAALRHEAADRGYFGQPVPAGPEPSWSGRLLAVGHSLGVLCALDHAPAALLAINGFARLAQGADWPHGVAPRVLARMAARLATDADAVVGAFRHQQGCDAPLPGPARPGPLAEDLDRLRQADARQALSSYSGPMRVLAGRQDTLADPALTAASFPGRRVAMLEGGHLLPLSHPAACAQAVLDLAERLGG